ncbi:MAG: hypothetical protein ACR2MA_00150 [Egibacteraceae bacterium]
MTAEAVEATEHAGLLGLEQRVGLLLGQRTVLDGGIQTLLQLRAALGLAF